MDKVLEILLDIGYVFLFGLVFAVVLNLLLDLCIRSPRNVPTAPGNGGGGAAPRAVPVTASAGGAGLHNGAGIAGPGDVESSTDGSAD